MRHVLLVNPWITDFAAHDLWARPLGLLHLAGVVRDLGCEAHLIDCTDRHHPSLDERPYKPRPWSCGKYPAEEFPKPICLRIVPRKYKRYGISEDAFRTALDGVPAPDLILVGSRMTYWYPGVHEVVRILRDRFRQTEIAIGGVYPTLFPGHASRLDGTDWSSSGEGELELANRINGLLDGRAKPIRFNLDDIDSLPKPAVDLLPARDTLPFAMSRGCPRKCTYCASRRLFGRFRRQDPLRAADDLVRWIEEFGFSDVAFYDDALLADKGRYFVPFAERVLESGVAARFHTPNGLDYAAIDQDLAGLFARLNFKTIRLSLETADPGHLAQVGRNPDLGRFESALEALEAAGFDLPAVGVYILMGLPGQSRGEVENTVDYVLSLGAVPKLGEFSPLPGTREWDEVSRVGEPPVEEEPLLTNNSVFYRLDGRFPDSWVNGLRARIREALKKR